MEKSHVVRAWTRKTGAEDFLQSKSKAFALGWKLLNDYQHFVETGRCADTQSELYDFSQFIHNFADRYAGKDDALYQWIAEKGQMIIEVRNQQRSDDKEIPNTHCPLCSTPLTTAKVARDSNGSVRLSAAGRAWCNECATKVDNRNWRSE